MSSSLSNGYQPRPIAMDGVELPESLDELLEALARHAHDIWALQKIADGWTWGPTKSEERKEHSCLVEYCELAEGDKEYDRLMVKGTLRAILALGYTVSKPG
jgi:hypothetical protein